MLRKFAFIALIMATFNSQAWEAAVTTEYVLGEGDSRIMARKHVREALTVEAAKQGEMYVQTTTRLEDDQLSEVVEVLGASMVRITDYEEHFKLNSTGATVLVASATATVDESELEQRIQKAQEDTSVQDELLRLSIENRRLRERLDKARAIGISDSFEKLEKRLADLSGAYRGLESNRASVNEVFEKGALLALADSYAVELEQAKATIQRNVLDEILDTEVDVELDGVKETPEGYRAQVMLGWKLDTPDFRKILSPWLTVGRDRFGRELIQNPGSAAVQAKSKLSVDLYDWLAGQQIDVVVNVEGEEVTVPLLYSAYSFMSETCAPQPNAIGKDATNNYFERSRICMAEAPGRGEEFPGTHLENPLALNLTKAQVANATSVDVEVRWREL